VPDPHWVLCEDPDPELIALCPDCFQRGDDGMLAVEMLCIDGNWHCPKCVNA
jgi:hypothetical protein